MKRVYVFVARNIEEFLKYPGTNEGYFCNDRFRLPYRHKWISHPEFAILILNEFSEKNALLEKAILKGEGFAFQNPDALLEFSEVLSAMLKKSLGIDGKEYEVTAFIHFGGLPICSASILASAINTRYNTIRSRKKYEELARAQLKGMVCYAISTTAPQRLDLMSQKIHLPENENEMSEFIKRFDSAEGVRGKIRECFKKKWECDSVRTASDRVVDDTDYIANCKELGFVAKEVL